mgnify:CR=1 FL=1
MSEKLTAKEYAEKLLYTPEYAADKQADVKEKAAAFAEGAALAAKADNAAAAALLADAEHKKRGSAPKKRRYDFDF